MPLLVETQRQPGYQARQQALARIWTEYQTALRIERELGEIQADALTSTLEANTLRQARRILTHRTTVLLNKYSELRAAPL